jgi:hypothetical protein
MGHHHKKGHGVGGEELATRKSKNSQQVVARCTHTDVLVLLAASQHIMCICSLALVSNGIRCTHNLVKLTCNALAACALFCLRCCFIRPPCTTPCVAVRAAPSSPRCPCRHSLCACSHHSSNQQALQAAGAGWLWTCLCSRHAKYDNNSNS